MVKIEYMTIYWVMKLLKLRRIHDVKQSNLYLNCFYEPLAVSCSTLAKFRYMATTINGKLEHEFGDGKCYNTNNWMINLNHYTCMKFCAHFFSSGDYLIACLILINNMEFRFLMRQMMSLGVPMDLLYQSLLRPPKNCKLNLYMFQACLWQMICYK